MSNFFELVKVNYKTGMNAFGQYGLGRDRKKEKSEKGKKKGKTGQILLYIFLIAALAVSMGPAGYQMTQACIAAEVPQLVAATLSMALMVMSFFYALMSLPGFLFFAEDTENYLAMPIRAHDLILARLVSALYSLFLMNALLFLPFIIGSLIANFSVQALLGMILTFIFMPIIPYCLVTILYLWILSLAPKFRNKGRLGIFTSIMSAVLAIGYGMLTARLSSGADQDMWDAMINQGPFYQNIGKFYPPLIGAQWMTASPDTGKAVLGLVIILALTFLAILLTMLVADRTYIPIALSMTSNASNEAKLSQSQVKERVQSSESVRKAFRKREWNTLFHNSDFLVNTTMPTFYLPLIMIAIFFFMGLRELGDHGLGLSVVREQVLETLGGDWEGQFEGGGIVGLLMAFYTTASSLAATSISREGSHINLIKSFPIMAPDFFFGKFQADYLATIFHIPVAFLVSLIIIPFMPVLHFTFILTDLLTIYALSIFEFYLNMKSPKLDWTSPIEAIKNTKGQILASVLGLGFFFAFIALLAMGNLSPSRVIAIALACLAALAIWVTYLIKKNGQKILIKMDVA